MANESTTTATIELELVALDGSVRKVSLAAGQTSIEAAPGVRIERVPEGLRLSIEGEEVSLPWQAELTFAGLVWRLADAPGKSAQGGQSTLLLALLGVALVWTLSGEEADEGFSAAPEAPALFAESQGCEGVDAAAVGPLDERRGLALLERYPFAAADGLRAVAALDHARACAELSGDVPRAEELASVAQRLRERIGEDFRASRFRLERALENGEREPALRETRVLSELLADRPGPYREWLRRLATELSSADTGEAS